MPEPCAATIDRHAKPRFLTASEHDQIALYDTIAQDYQAHYGDKYSALYRDKFIHGPLYRGQALRNKSVLDAACGSGETTRYLLAQGANVTGLDLSPKMIDLFQARFPQAKGVCNSIYSTGFADNTFDCVSVILGLHHFHPDLQKAVDEIHRILKPGGIFCFCEPCTGTLPDIARRIWYRHDRSQFAENEAAVDPEMLLEENAAKFRRVSQRYGGNVAYLSVLCSLILRIPVKLKRFYSPFAMFLESLVSPWQPKLLSCFVLCQWEKKSS